MFRNWIATSLLLGLASVGRADFPYENEPINYSKTEPQDDPIARLQRRLSDGEAKLEFDESHGYLKSLLKELGVPSSSQGLVFSKTSFQLRRISPRTPRAIYFNDEVYAGWVQDGDVIELSAADPQLGANFYTLAQTPTGGPKFTRHTDNCLVCHASSRTSDVPGHVVRSVFVDRGGLPVFAAGTYNTNHESRYRERWGGWYVTGQHGSLRHMGNELVRNTSRAEELNVDAGANVTDLSSRFDVSPYVSPHSDIVALLILEHQTHMHNLITRAGFEGRSALWYNEVLAKSFNEPASYRSESTTRRLKHAAESLLEYGLFLNEPELESRVVGSSKFAEEFAALGPRDKRGRSLRDFDLEKRLFKYPCSYLIYSPPFDALPAEVRDHFYRRLWEILSGRDTSPKFARLTADERRAITEILADTKRGLPDYWQIAK